MGYSPLSALNRRKQAAGDVTPNRFVKSLVLEDTVTQRIVKTYVSTLSLGASKHHVVPSSKSMTGDS